LSLLLTTFVHKYKKYFKEIDCFFLNLSSAIQNKFDSVGGKIVKDIPKADFLKSGNIARAETKPAVRVS
jgi:hypothetical protein